MTWVSTRRWPAALRIRDDSCVANGSWMPAASRGLATTYFRVLRMTTQPTIRPRRRADAEVSAGDLGVGGPAGWLGEGRQDFAPVELDHLVLSGADLQDVDLVVASVGIALDGGAVPVRVRPADVPFPHLLGSHD